MMLVTCPSNALRARDKRDHVEPFRGVEGQPQGLFGAPPEAHDHEDRVERGLERADSWAARERPATNDGAHGDARARFGPESDRSDDARHHRQREALLSVPGAQRAGLPASPNHASTRAIPATSRVVARRTLPRPPRHNTISRTFTRRSGRVRDARALPTLPSTLRAGKGRPGPTSRDRARLTTTTTTTAATSGREAPTTMATADETETTIDALRTAAQTLATAGNTGTPRGARVTATSTRTHGVVTYASEADLLRDLDAGSPLPARVDRASGASSADSAVMVHESATHVLLVARLRKP